MVAACTPDKFLWKMLNYTFKKYYMPLIIIIIQLTSGQNCVGSIGSNVWDGIGENANSKRRGAVWNIKKSFVQCSSWFRTLVSDIFKNKMSSYTANRLVHVDCCSVQIRAAVPVNLILINGQEIGKQRAVPYVQSRDEKDERCFGV